jgi:hypothetical protein
LVGKTGTVVLGAGTVTVMSSLGRCMRASRGGLVSACVAFASGGGNASAGIRSTNNEETRTLGTDSARNLHLGWGWGRGWAQAASHPRLH